MTSFVVTNIGAAAAAGAGNPNGMAVEITSFRVGSSFGYRPERTQTALRGNTLYQGTVSAIRQHSADTKAVIIEIPTSAGPWDFGEIGLYLKTGELYAVATFAQPIRKLSVLVDQVPHAPVFHCLMKFGPGGSASFTLVDGPSGSNLLEVSSFAYVTAPVWMPNLPNTVIVHEGDTLPAVLIYRNTDYTWVPAGFDYVGTFDGVMPNATTVASSYLNTHTSTLFGDMLIQDQWGRMRYTSYISNGSAVLSSAIPITPGMPSTKFTMFRRTNSLFSGSGSDGESDSGFLTSAEARWLWLRLNLFTGDGSGALDTRGGQGLGLTDIPVPAGTSPTDAEWAALTTRINAARQHVAAPNDSNPLLYVLEAPKRTNPIMYGSRVAELARTVSDLTTYGRRPTGAMETAVQLAYSRTLTQAIDWFMSRMSVDLVWSSMRNANIFFNAGGFVDFRMRSGRKSYVGWLLANVLQRLGPIRFWANGVETMGPLKLTYSYSEGAASAAGAGLGWAGVGSTYRLMFNYSVPVFANESLAGDPSVIGGINPTDEAFILSLYARAIDNGVNLRFSFSYTGIDSSTVNSPALLERIGTMINGLEEPVLNEQPTFWLTDQRANIYVVTGRRWSSPLVTPPWPTVTVSTADTIWGVPITIDANSLEMSGGAVYNPYWGTVR